MMLSQLRKKTHKKFILSILVVLKIKKYLSGFLELKDYIKTK